MPASERGLVDLADQYLDIPYGNLHKQLLITKKEGKGASKRFTIVVDPSLDLCFRKLLRRSDYWLYFYMSYVIFGPTVGSYAGGTLVDINS